MRDFVYRLQHRRGFGRLTMTRAAPRRGMVLPRGVAARSPRAEPRRTSSTRTRCIRRRGCDRATSRWSSIFPARRIRATPPICSRPMRWSPTAGPPRICRRCSAAPVERVPEGRRCRAVPARRTERARRRCGCDGKRVVLTVGAARADQERRAARRRDGASCAQRDPRRAPADRRRRTGGSARSKQHAARLGSRRRGDVRRLRAARARRRRSIAPPTCSRCRPTSTTRRTWCSKRWRAGCRSWPPTSAASREFVADRRRRTRRAAARRRRAGGGARDVARRSPETARAAGAFNRQRVRERILVARERAAAARRLSAGARGAARRRRASA